MVTTLLGDNDMSRKTWVAVINHLARRCEHLTFADNQAELECLDSILQAVERFGYITT
jgi:hypothetical protein